MRRKEVPGAGLLKATLAGKITHADGARAMHLSLRQFHRVKVRFAAEGGTASSIACGAARRPTVWRPSSVSARRRSCKRPTPG